MIYSGNTMKTVYNRVPAIAAMILLAATACTGQQIRITHLNTTSGELEFTLSPEGTVYDYSCSAEWRSTLTAGSWTNAWYQPFTPFASSNGMFYAALPRFFRIRSTEGETAGTSTADYTVTGVIPSQFADGVIYWPDTGNTDLTYYVEHATGTNGPWLSQWTAQTNIHATATVTNSFYVPLFFRVVTITDSGELPW
jgi:uncharacterized protein with LGFP repeats